MPFFSRVRLSSYSSTALYTGAVIAPLMLAPLAAAEDKEIDDDRTTAVTTSSFLGQSGKLTITENGTIKVSGGAPLTIDGNHTLSMNGELSSASTLSGIGLKVDTGDDLRLTSGIDIDGKITVTGPTAVNTATTNVGLGLFGGGVFDGNIKTTIDSAISVGGANAKGIYIGSDMEGNLVSNGGISLNGANSIGIHIEGDVDGDVSIDGSISAPVKGATGVLVSGSIDGAFVHEGSIIIGKNATTDSDGDPVDAVPATAGVHITNDITGGVYFGGTGINDKAEEGETIPQSTIASTGGAPAFLVENLKDDGSDLVLGAISGEDYAVIHKGTMTSKGVSSGIESWGMRFAGAGENEWVRLEGGMYLDRGRVSVSALDATAIGIEVGDYTDIPKLLNRGVIEAVTSVTSSTDSDNKVTYSEGGDAIALSVTENGQLPVLRNRNSIVAVASGEGKDAFAVQDKSGTLSSISNYGILSATLGTNNTTGDAVALDVSANTTGVTLYNTGKITGDIWMGSGNDRVELTEGTLTGDIKFGAGADELLIAGDAIFTGGVSHEGTLNLTLSGADLSLGVNDRFEVTTANLTGESTLFVTIDPLTGKSGLFDASGEVIIGEDVAITPVFETFITEAQEYDLLQAGSITLGGALEQPTLANQSFLLNSSLTLSGEGDKIILEVRPKTAEELSLSGNKAKIYEGILDSLDPADDLGGALAQLEDAEGVDRAMEAILPDTTNAMFQMAYSGARQLEATLGDRMITATANRRVDGGFWARELVGFGTADIADSAADSDYLGAGVLIGFDKNLNKNVLWGISTGFLLQGSSREGDIGDDVSLFTPFVSSYLMASDGALFLTGSASFWYNSVTRSRGLNVETVNKSIESNSNGWTGSVDAHVGYDLKLGGLHIRPKIGANYIRAKESGYTEEGGDGANLVVEGRNFNRLDGVGSVSIGHDFLWKGQGENAVYVRPEVFGSYRKRLSGTSQFITSARFESGTEFFELNNDAIADTSTEMGANLNIFSGFGAATLRYTYEKREDWRAHYGGFNFQMQF
ncbi:autotransporter outer membrane beta-barrel domain-containing protein [Kordiimonas sp.]|uniref:autotransporter outer membrane beta-barrel domain-containing protein n=1 Tax=Kordiimonas sp. TaxID=1970157 RepID=UPI003A929638